MESIYSEGSENTKSEKNEEVNFQEHVNLLIKQIRESKELHKQEKLKLQQEEKEIKKKEEFRKKQRENKFTLDIHDRPQMKTGAKINYFDKFRPVKGKFLSATEQYRVMLTAKSYQDPKRNGKAFRYSSSYGNFFSRDEEGGRAFQRPPNITEIRQEKELAKEQSQIKTAWMPTNAQAKYFSLPPVNFTQKIVNNDIQPFKKSKPFKRSKPFGTVFSFSAASII